MLRETDRQNKRMRDETYRSNRKGAQNKIRNPRLPDRGRDSERLGFGLLSAVLVSSVYSSLRERISILMFPFEYH